MAVFSDLSITAAAANMRVVGVNLTNTDVAFRFGGVGGIPFNDAAGILIGTAVVFGTTPQSGFASLAGLNGVAADLAALSTDVDTLLIAQIPPPAPPFNGGTLSISPTIDSPIEIVPLHPESNPIASTTLHINSSSRSTQILLLSFRSGVTALTISGSNIDHTSNLAAPTTVAAGQTLGYHWALGSAVWRRFL